jgi:hypothetical protein
MRKLTVDDISDLRAYEREREGFLAEVIAMKKRRRIHLGDLMTIVFENADTMRFQIQEMARAEKMLRDDQIAHEVEVYNQLVPDDGELSGTLFIEIDDQDLLRRWLPRLVGIEDHVALVLDDCSEVRSEERDPDRLTREEVTTTVHYLRFTFTEEQRSTFAGGTVHLVVDHPEYRAQTVLTEEQHAELQRDLWRDDGS